MHAGVGVVESAGLDVAGEGGAGEETGGPIGFAFSADGFVESDGGLVPIEDGPLHTTAAVAVGEVGEVEDERFAEALTAEFRADEKVFEIKTWLGEEGGVVEKIEGEAGGCRRGRCRVGVGVNEKALSHRATIGGEEGSAEGFLSSDDFMGEFFVVSEAADEIEDERNVGGGGGADERRHGRKERVEMGGGGNGSGDGK